MQGNSNEERFNMTDDQEVIKENGKTKGVETLLGDPKKAVIKLSIPMIIAMLVQTAYNLFDAIWVAGLGADALAAVGFVFPIFFAALGIANGLGIGGSSAISRWIGAGDKGTADSTATHTIVLMVLLALAFTVPMVIFSEAIYTAMGAGVTTVLATEYSTIIFSFSIIIFFTSVAMAILRGEGDTKRPMYAMVLGSVLNIVLDPIFIYGLDMGIGGAAWATVVSFGIAAGLLFYWLLMERSTYVSFMFRGFRFRAAVLRDILRVGLPASMQQLSMSITALIMNLVILTVSTTDGVAVYATGWRIFSVAIVPLIGIASAVTPISGAAFGSKRFSNIRKAHLFATRMGIVIEVLLGVGMFVFAAQIAAVFTSSEGASQLAPDLIVFLQVMAISNPFVALGMFSSSVFQGVGRGTSALLATVLRTLVLTTFFAFLLANTLGLGLVGVWMGVALANTIGSIIVFGWVRSYYGGLIREAERKHPSLEAA
jgi:putative MATE family efflux protein